VNEQELAHQPRAVDHDPDDEWMARPGLAALWGQTTTAEPSRNRGQTTGQGPIPEKITEQRHNTIRRRLVWLAHTGACVAELRAYALAMNEARCTPPLPEDEVRALAAWAADLPADEPEEDDGWCQRCAPRGQRLEEQLERQKAINLPLNEENANLKHRMAAINAVVESDTAQNLKIPAIGWITYLEKDPKRRAAWESGKPIPFIAGGRREDVPPEHPDYGKPLPGSFAAHIGGGTSTALKAAHAFEKLRLMELREDKVQRQNGTFRKQLSAVMRYSAGEFLRHVAVVSEEEREGQEGRKGRHGGARPRCENCGSEDTLTLTLCAHCFEVLHATRSPERHDDVPAGGLQPALGEQPLDAQTVIEAVQEVLRERRALERHDDVYVPSTPKRHHDVPAPPAAPSLTQFTNPNGCRQCGSKDFEYAPEAGARTATCCACKVPLRASVAASSFELRSDPNLVYPAGKGGCTCGGLLILLSEGGQSVLRCNRCGHVRAPDGGDPPEVGQ